MGSAKTVQKAVHEHSIVLAAHSPNTAKGAGDVQLTASAKTSFAGLVPMVGRISDTLPKNAPICRAW